MEQSLEELLNKFQRFLEKSLEKYIGISRSIPGRIPKISKHQWKCVTKAGGIPESLQESQKEFRENHNLKLEFLLEFRKEFLHESLKRFLKESH